MANAGALARLIPRLGPSDLQQFAVEPHAPADGANSGASPPALQPRLPTRSPMEMAAGRLAGVNLQPRIRSVADPLPTAPGASPIPLVPRLSPADVRFDPNPAQNRALYTPPREMAEYEVGPMPKRGKWGGALDIALGALAGITGQQLPDELTPLGRQRLREQAIDKRAGELRQEQADRWATEDRQRAIDASALQQEYIRSQIEQNRARAEAALQPRLDPKISVGEGTATVYDPNANTLRYIRDPNAPERAPGNVQQQWGRDADGNEVLFERDAQSGAWRQAAGPNGQPITRAAKPERPTQADRNAALEARVEQYMGTEGAIRDLATLKKQLVYGQLQAIDPHLDPDNVRDEIDRLQVQIDAPLPDGSKDSAASQYAKSRKSAAAQRLAAIQAALRYGEDHGPALYRSRVKATLGGQDQGGQGAYQGDYPPIPSGRSALTKP